MDTRTQIACLCGKRLFDRIDLAGVEPSGVVEIDCDQCGYLLYRLRRHDGEAIQRRSYIVVHRVDVGSGIVVDSEVYRARATPFGRDLEPVDIDELDRALTRPWQDRD